MRFSFFRAFAVMPPAALLLASAVAADPPATARWESLDSLVDNPPVRWGHAALHDPLRDRMIVYGGGASPRDVWTMSLGQPTIWSILPTEGPGPTPRRLAVCAIDTHRDRLIVFGGHDTIHGSTDVWALSLSEPHVWEQIVPAGPAVTSTGNTVGVYDPVGDRLVVFDAVDPTGAETGLLWQLPLAGTPAWSAFPGTGAQPARRRGAAAIYDPLRRRMVLFQGWNGGYSSSGSVWALDLAGTAGWTQLADATTTGNREHYSAALDAKRDRVLVFGGEHATGFPFGDTEAFHLGSRVWTDLGVTTTERVNHAAIVDPLRDRMIVHGGGHEYYLDATNVEMLEFTTLTWKTIGPPVPGDRPQPRAAHAVIHDPVRDCLWMTVGGTWRFDLAAPRWRPVASPDPSRSAGGVIRDALRDRLIATFGNRYGTSLWQFDAATETWTTLQPIGTPTYERQSASYAYDPLRDRLLMFGGFTEGTRFDLYWNELWALNFSPQLEWVELHPGGTAPAPRYAAAMVYDPVRDRLLVHGGVAAFSPTDELWELPLSGTFDWNLVAQENAPERRYGHTMLYDASRDRLLILGGGDVWALTLGGPTLTWEELEQSDERPLPRFTAGGAIDPTRNQIILFGGFRMGDILDDTWRLTLPDLVSASRERSIGPGPGREVRFEGSGPVPGLAQKRSAIGEIELKSPAPAFELRLAGASPVEGPVEFEIRLPDASPGRFEVFDVAGRRWSSRAVTAGGDGRVRVRLTSDEMRAPGLCFARVRHGAEERRVRFVRLP